MKSETKMIKELNVGDKVSLYCTSDRFPYKDKSVIYIVDGFETDGNLILLKDDSHKIELYPHRGKSRIHIQSKFFNDFEIVNQNKDE